MSDGDGTAEDGLIDGGVEGHHHCLWQVELPQLPQEVHPLIGLFCKGPDVQIPLEVLGDDGAQETERQCRLGESQGDGGVGGCTFRTLSEVQNHPHHPQSIELQFFPA